MSGERRLWWMQHYEWFDVRSPVLHWGEGDWYTGKAWKASSFRCLGLKGTSNGVQCGPSSSDLDCNSGIDRPDGCPHGTRQWIGSTNIFVPSRSCCLAKKLGRKVLKFRYCEVDVHESGSTDLLQISDLGDECRRDIHGGDFLSGAP